MAQDTLFVTGDVVGVDLGDKSSFFAVLSRRGRVRHRGSMATSKTAFSKTFSGPPCRVVIEVGTHSRWVSELLKTLGHEVIVANARQLPLIYKSRKKNDPVDAERLARLGRVDPRLLEPITHRARTAQVDLALVKARDHLVRLRTKLINHVRGTTKAFGERLPRCSSEAFHKRAAEAIPEDLRLALNPILETLAELTTRIRRYDKQLEQLSTVRYPVTEILREIRGVGPVTALAFLLVLEDHGRFRNGRAVGSFLGLVPRLDESGESQPQLRITKAGDGLVRRVLVTAANYILGPKGEDCDLRRWGTKIMERGGKNAKKRAVVAVARKLAVLLHHLWRNGEVYDPNYNEKQKLLRAS